MARKPDTPCASCGRLLWSGKTSLPAGLRVCHPCRRVTPQRNGPIGRYRRNPERSVSCARCGERFTTTFTKQRFCSNQCRERIRDSDRRDAIRRLRKGRPYRRLRDQVLAEESMCWLCDQPTGSAPWPDPMSGTIDHVVPVSVDPKRVLDRTNVRAAHLRCNARRSDYQFGKRMLVAVEA